MSRLNSFAEEDDEESNVDDSWPSTLPSVVGVQVTGDSPSSFTFESSLSEPSDLLPPRVEAVEMSAELAQLLGIDTDDDGGRSKRRKVVGSNN